jgi:uncharacterized membrane-anchored protein YitT (DUF2179 family)
VRPQFDDIIDNITRFFKPDFTRSVENIKRQRAALQWRKQFNNNIRDLLQMLMGVFSAGFGLKGFLIPNGFIDGGAMGISLLASAETQLSLSFYIILINLPFLLLSWKQISRSFSLRSILAIVILAFVVNFVPYPMVTDDKLLVAIFGGFFLGAGIGLAIRGGCVIDGTEVLAIYLSRRNSLSVGDFILIFNILIFSIAAYLLTMEVALYSILTYLAASKTVDFILEGIEEFTGVTIISAKSQQIIDMIHNKLRRGLTIYTGKSGFGKRGESSNTSDIIFTVITRLEVNRLSDEVERIDKNAFIFMHSIKDTRGGMVKKLPLKKIKSSTDVTIGSQPGTN